MFEVINNANVLQTLITVDQVAGIQHRLTATTQDENDIGIHSMKMVISLGLSTYPTQEVTFQLVVS